jgi:uncharacterized membrane protein
MKKSTVIDITIVGIFIAIIFVMAIVPFIGYIQIPPISFTTIIIPVLAFGLIIDGRRGIVLAGAFGISSWLIALTSAVYPVDLLFINPLISILPRVIWGVFIFLSFGLLNKLLNFIDKKTKKKLQDRIYKSLAIGSFTFILSLIHTLLVLSSFFLLKSQVEEAIGGSWTIITFFTMALTINGVIEAGFATVAMIILYPSLYSLRKQLYAQVNSRIDYHQSYHKEEV